MTRALETTRYKNIYKVGPNHFEIRVSTGKNPYTGKYGKKSEQFHGSLNDALARQSEMRRAVKQGRVAMNGWTMSELMDYYFDHRADELAPGTLRADKSRWRILEPGLGSRKARSITTYDVDELLKTVRRERGCKPQSIQRYQSLLSAAFDRGKKWGAVEFNPVSDSSNFTPEHVARTPVSVDILHKFLAYFLERNPDFADFLQLTLMLQARRSEMCALRVSDFNPIDRTITIERAVKQLPVDKKNKSAPRYVIGDSKAHNVRTFEISDAEVELIRKRISLLAGNGPIRLITPPSSYLFSNDGGRNPWLPDTLTGTMRRTAAQMCGQCGDVFLQAGKRRPESCEHCGIVLGVDMKLKYLRRLATTTQLRDKNTNPSYVQYRGGWKDAKVMLASYADHMSEDAVHSNAALSALLPTAAKSG